MTIVNDASPHLKTTKYSNKDSIWFHNYSMTLMFRKLLNKVCGNRINRLIAISRPFILTIFQFTLNKLLWKFSNFVPMEFFRGFNLLLADTDCFKIWIRDAHHIWCSFDYRFKKPIWFYTIARYSKEKRKFPWPSKLLRLPYHRMALTHNAIKQILISFSLTKCLRKCAKNSFEIDFRLFSKHFHFNS